MTTKDLIKDNNVHFYEYRNNVLYYFLTYEGEMYKFPIPAEDAKGATFLRNDKAITFMRWINSALKDKTFVKI